jgi:hypothetical protein
MDEVLVTFLKVTSVDEAFENLGKNIYGKVNIVYNSGNAIFPKKKQFVSTMSLALVSEKEFDIKQLLKDMGFMLPQSYSAVTRFMPEKEIARVCKNIKDVFV